MGKQWKQCQTLFFGGFKITADGDCSHEIKRCLLLGRKAMNNLDSIFKSRDITLPTKVRLVTAMVFPVVVYGCEFDCGESWAPKNWRFWTAVLEKTLESPLNCKEIQPVHSNNCGGPIRRFPFRYWGNLLHANWSPWPTFLPIRFHNATISTSQKVLLQFFKL